MLVKDDSNRQDLSYVCTKNETFPVPPMLVCARLPRSSCRSVALDTRKVLVDSSHSRSQKRWLMVACASEGLKGLNG